MKLAFLASMMAGGAQLGDGVEELRLAELYHSVWQAFPVLLPVSTVGVMGDERTYEKVVAIRAVCTIG